MAKSKKYQIKQRTVINNYDQTSFVNVLVKIDKLFKKIAEQYKKKRMFPEIKNAIST